MLIVDASSLFDALVSSGGRSSVHETLARDADHAAPHIVDVEVFSIIRREHRAGRLDQTAALQAVDRLGEWRGQRFPHGPLLERAWELRDNVRGWDAMYVALAEQLGATLVTGDRRLAAAAGPRCPFIVVD